MGSQGRGLPGGRKALRSPWRFQRDAGLPEGVAWGELRWSQETEAEAGVELGLPLLLGGARPEPRMLGARLGEQVGPESASWARSMGREKKGMDTGSGLAPPHLHVRYGPSTFWGCSSCSTSTSVSAYHSTSKAQPHSLCTIVAEPQDQCIYC